MGRVKKNYMIRAKKDRVSNYLMDPVKIENWSGSPAIMEKREGGIFSLWEGSIHGINRKITEAQIVQDWKEKSWENFSRVTMNLIPAEDGKVTELELIHEDIPEASVHSIDRGWDEYYFGPLIDLMEKYD
jgi:activator of HSP90 ATPase